ncbi:MAG TPA: hypothetical protein VHB98_07570 [Chloroflexota bacterium]|nr:hypothetical protein [Chloroflexota bacterium]
MNDELPRTWWGLLAAGVVCVLVWLITGRHGDGVFHLVGWVGALAIGFFLVGRLAVAF